MAKFGWEMEIEKRVRALSDLQTWAGHYDVRFPELREIGKLMPEKASDFLELGCGNGLATAFFSDRYQNLIGSDLPDVSHEQHSIGLGKAKALAEKLGLKNVNFVGCSAECLPFAADSYDVILGIYCLEHVPDKDKCLRECYRVLRKNGTLVISVPGFWWSVFYPIGFYHELFWRLWARLTYRWQRHSGPKKEGEKLENGATTPAAHSVNSFSKFRQVYPHFPIPKPHGEFASYFHELFSLRRASWQARFERAGFRLVEMQPLSVLPLAIFNVFLGQRLGTYVSRKLLSLDHWLCRRQVFKVFAQFFCFRLEKK